ncbi:MAG: phage portal protein [Gaiellaceae bacterium]
MPAADIAWALREVNATKRRRAYKLYRDYYDGRHRMAYSKERFKRIFNGVFEEIVDNICPAIVDAVSDRLKITGFSSTAAKTKVVADASGKSRARVSDPLASKAHQIWERNKMGLRSNEVYRESLIAGDGYVIVWPDPSGRAAIWPQEADEMAVEYSDLVPGELARATRVWKQEDGRLRVNLYYPGHTERYVSRSPGASTARATFDPVPGVDDMVVGEGDDAEVLVGVLENPYGQVPVFHFPNKRLYQYGTSQLSDVVPLQDGLNKSVCDLIVAAEFASYRQRWATGLEDPDDDESGKPKESPFKPGPDRVFTIESKDAKFGDFSETDLSQFIEVQENLRAEAARVSGTPLHYLFITKGDYPSGEAMKSAEARFSGILEDRQESFGNAWEKALAFALLIEGARVPKDFELKGQWVPATPRSEEEIARTLILKRKLGISRYQALREAGYDDDLIEQMFEADDGDQAAAADPTLDPAATGAGGNGDLNPAQP